MTQLDKILNIYTDITKKSRLLVVVKQSALDGAYRDRTDDLLRAKQALSQLS